MTMDDIHYSARRTVTPTQFVDVLERSTLAARRPVEDSLAIALMLGNADLMVTAWHGEALVGIARSVTDYGYCCYLSDLAVDRRLQRRGIGRELVRRTRTRLGPRCRIILLAAPAAMDYYPRLGFERHAGAWVLPPDTAPGATAP